jgi:hypothetical protein
MMIEVMLGFYSKKETFLFLYEGIVLGLGMRVNIIF